MNPEDQQQEQPQPEQNPAEPSEPNEVDTDDDGTPAPGDLVHNVDADGNPVAGPGGLTGHGIVIGKGDGTHTVGYFATVQTVDSASVKSGPEPTSAE